MLFGRGLSFSMVDKPREEWSLSLGPSIPPPSSRSIISLLSLPSFSFFFLNRFLSLSSLHWPLIGKRDSHITALSLILLFALSTIDARRPSLVSNCSEISASYCSFLSHNSRCSVWWGEGAVGVEGIFGVRWGEVNPTRIFHCKDTLRSTVNWGPISSHCSIAQTITAAAHCSNAPFHINRSSQDAPVPLDTPSQFERKCKVSHCTMLSRRSDIFREHCKTRDSEILVQIPIAPFPCSTRTQSSSETANAQREPTARNEYSLHLSNKNSLSSAREMKEQAE